jgi:superfamily II helicase
MSEKLDLLKSIINDNSEIYFSVKYIEEMFLGIKTCKSCGIKESTESLSSKNDFEYCCSSCERDSKINELGLK